MNFQNPLNSHFLPQIIPPVIIKKILLNPHPNLILMARRHYTKEEKIMRKELAQKDFRVAIFGSARIKENDKFYKQVFELAADIGRHGFDIVTGGGPGLMEAANAGHTLGDPNKLSDNIGLPIRLPWENRANKHLEIKRHFNKFSDRLDTFVALSSAIVVVPGGIGTCLELFYIWQLIQVRHIPPMPIILVGKMWEEMLKWVREYPIKQGLVSKEEDDWVYVAKNNKEAMEIILKAHKQFIKHGRMTNHSVYKIFS